MRFDQALAQALPDYSRSRLKAWIDAGQVTLDGEPADPKRKVWGGEEVVVAAAPDPRETAFAPESIALSIVYEDETLLVVDKAAGLVMHPGSGNWEGTMLNALLHHAPQQAGVPRAGIVHRLDKDTSGLVVVAKTLAAQTDLVRQLQARTVQREYLAVAAGDIVARRHRRRADRPPPVAPDHDGGRRDRPAGAHALHRRRALRRRDAAALPPGNRPHPPDPRASRLARPPAPRRSGLRQERHRRHSRARHCTRSGWDCCTP